MEKIMSQMDLTLCLTSLLSPAFFLSPFPLLTTVVRENTHQTIYIPPAKEKAKSNSNREKRKEGEKRKRERIKCITEPAIEI